MEHDGGLRVKTMAAVLAHCQHPRKEPVGDRLLKIFQTLVRFRSLQRAMGNQMRALRRYSLFSTEEWHRSLGPRGSYHCLGLLTRPTPSRIPSRNCHCLCLRGSCRCPSHRYLSHRYLSHRHHRCPTSLIQRGGHYHRG